MQALTRLRFLENFFLQFFLGSLNFYKLWHSAMSTHLIKGVKQQLVYVSTWMADRLSFRPGMGCIRPGNCFCHQTFINSSAVLVSLMALLLAHFDQNTFRPCSFASHHSQEIFSSQFCRIISPGNQWTCCFLLVL